MKHKTKKMARPARAIPTAVRDAPIAVAKAIAPAAPSEPTSWSPLYSYLLLTLSTILCLAPFTGRAFHVDDTLFVRAAQQIVAHPLDPYGFEINWDLTRAPMSEVTQNPPLASYYIALIARFAGWSERALHLGFVLIAVALVLGTYRLAGKFTRSPLLAAVSTLLAPGVMVSATSLMCDTMMLALWIWAAFLWIEGLDSQKTWPLIVSGLFTGASALTKYFGASLILLLLVYSIVRLRRVGVYLLCLLIPVAMLLGYEFWTNNLYGHGLLQSAADFAQAQRAGSKGSLSAMFAVSLSFTGGCSLLGIFFAPFLWARKWVATGVAASGLLSYALIADWLDTGLRVGTGVDHSLKWLIGVQLLLCIAGGMSVLALSIRDLIEKRNAESLLLGLWVGGTFFFAAFVNYTVNARSIMPLIPATAILLARHFDKRPHLSSRWPIAAVLLVSAGLSFWITYADSELANSARTAAARVYEKVSGKGGHLFFEGHWGFQYYMESKGAEPLDLENPQAQSGDFIAIPRNNVQMREISSAMVASQESIEIPMKSWASAISWQLGAGFYSSYWGPLPYAIGPVPAEEYLILKLGTLPARSEMR